VVWGPVDRREVGPFTEEDTLPPGVGNEYDELCNELLGGGGAGGDGGMDVLGSAFAELPDIGEEDTGAMWGGGGGGSGGGGGGGGGSHFGGGGGVGSDAGSTLGNGGVAIKVEGVAGGRDAMGGVDTTGLIQQQRPSHSGGGGSVHSGGSGGAVAGGSVHSVHSAHSGGSGGGGGGGGSVDSRYVQTIGGAGGSGGGGIGDGGGSGGPGNTGGSSPFRLGLDDYASLEAVNDLGDNFLGPILDDSAMPFLAGPGIYCTPRCRHRDVCCTEPPFLELNGFI